MNIAITAYGLYLATGGTERFVADLANAMLKRGHNIYIYANDHGKKGTKKPVFDLEPSIKTYLCSLELWQYGEQKEILRMRKRLLSDKIDVLLSPQASGMHILWALCCLGTGIPFICSERSAPFYIENLDWNKPGRYASLACADIIHLLLTEHKKSIPEIWQDKVKIIPNALTNKNFKLEQEYLAKNLSKANTREKIILFLARYIPSKRADLLIEAFALLAKEFPGWQLKLVGHGEEKAKLENLVHKLNLQAQVQICKQTDNAFKEYAKAQIYCLPTQYEGFPNTVIEAMASGLAVVGIADCEAMTALIRHGKTGLLAKSATALDLAHTLKELLISNELRSRLAENALIESRNLYAEDRVFAMWEDLFNEALLKKGQTIMDSFDSEPFASKMRLSSMARREYILRGFGEPMPYSLAWFKERISNIFKNIFRNIL